MKSAKEIEDMARDYTETQSNTPGNGWDFFDVKNAYQAGFQKCQELIDKECEKGFDEWMKSEDRHDGVFGNNNNFSRDEWIAENTWRAAKLSSLKEVEDLKAESNRFINHHIEMCNDYTDRINKLHDENKELKTKLAQVEAGLNEAVSVCEFYANKWTWKREPDRDLAREIREDDLSFVSGYSEHTGGKRARAFLTKINNQLSDTK
jgi:hypothetical protein